MEDEVICGTCDLCGDEADGNVSECNALSCTFVQCGLSTEKGILYHQACLDKFLRKEKLDKSRKTGFKCPRGCGKGSKYPSECPGRIDKSHPIFPRNETKKNKPVVIEPPPPPKPPPKKEKEQTPPTATAATTNGIKPSPVAPNKAPEAPVAPKAQASSPAPAPPLNGTAKSPPQPSAAAAAALAKEQLMEAKLALRRDLGLERSVVQPKPTLAPTPSLTPSRVTLQPTSSAPPESSPLQPGVHTLAAFMQMLPSKPSAPKPATAAASLFTPSPTLSPSPSQPGLLLQSQQQFPPVQGSGPPLIPSAASVPTPSPWGATPSPAAPLSSVASEPSSHPPPPPPRQQGAPPVLTTTAGPAYIPVGMEGDEEGEEGGRAGLTRAQKKNLKRQEKKKRAAANANDPSSDARSSHSDEGSDDEGNEGPSRRSGYEPSHSLLSTFQNAGPSSSSSAILGEMFIQSLLCRKALSVTRDLRRLSFHNWQGAAAVQRFGSDTLSSIAWLLECEGLSPEQLSNAPPLPPSSNYNGRPEASHGAPVDVTEELRQLSQVQSRLGLSADQVQSAVVDALGDVRVAVEVLMEKHAMQPHSSLVTLSQETTMASSSSLGEWGLGGGSNYYRTTGLFSTALSKQ